MTSLKNKFFAIAGAALLTACGSLKPAASAEEEPVGQPLDGDIKELAISGDSSSMRAIIEDAATKKLDTLYIQEAAADDQINGAFFELNDEGNSNMTIFNESKIYSGIDSTSVTRERVADMYNDDQSSGVKQVKITKTPDKPFETSGQKVIFKP